MNIRIAILSVCLLLAMGAGKQAAAAPAESTRAAAAAQPAKAVTLTGTISDVFCGLKHTMKNMSDADCTRMCVKGGLQYALVVGADIYTLQGHEAELAKFAGQPAAVTGNVSGRTIAVESVAPAAKR